MKTHINLQTPASIAEVRAWVDAIEGLAESLSRREFHRVTFTGHIYATVAPDEVR